MRETRADNAQGVVVSLALHVALGLVLFVGLRWSSHEDAAAAAGPPISAELVDPDALSAAMRRTLRQAPERVEPLPEPVTQPEQPLPEPVPEQAEAPAQPQAQDFIPVPDDVNQDAVVDAPTPRPADEQAPQEAKRRQEQVDLTQEQRQRDAQATQRPSPQELERQRQLEEIRKRRAQAARQRQLEEQRLQQLADAGARNASDTAARADAQASAAPGQGGVDEGLEARYKSALISAIHGKWIRPESVALGQLCRLRIRQIPGGRVIDVQVADPCAYDEAGRRSIEAAVLKAQPLPYAGFEPVFARDLTLNFQAQDR